MTNHKILVVEDNPATRKMVCFALGKRGHQVFDARDGKTALEVMEREQPVLVLQDLVLPDVDGFDLVSELRKLAQGQLAILAFSGFTSISDEARISSVGFDDVIIKPIEPSRLIQVVEAHLPATDLGADHFGTGRRLVIADDDPVQLKLTRFRLEKLGFVVEAASDGREALRMISRLPLPDAIISDVLMPNLDGFGLALAIRQDAKLNKLPLLLLTSSYVDESDRALARRAGANDLILRTPEQREMIQALRELLDSSPSVQPVDTAALSEIEKERMRRVVGQLERHVLMNAGLVRRCSALSAELAVLAGISEAVLKQQDTESALDEALASCFDAGGVSVGALYLLGPDGSLRVRPLGSKVVWQNTDVESFFGNPSLLREIMEGGTPVMLPSPEFSREPVERMLRRAGAHAAMVVPLVHVEEPMGALFMVTPVQAAEQEDWHVFAHGVGNQIAQALALARAFERREAAERQAVESRADWQALAENVPDTIIRVDREGIVRFVNRFTSPLTRADVLGKHWLEPIPTEHHEALGRAFATTLAIGEPSSHEIMLSSSDSKVDWCSTRIGPVMSDGKITGAIVISSLITQKKQQEAQLIVADRMASVGTLAAGVAHEINNPLAAVIANLDLAHREALELADRSGSRNFVDYLQDAQEAAERMRLIVRDLKVFSRGEEGTTGPTDVQAVLESTLRMGWNEIRHRARLVKNYASLPPVEANESRLGQVFLNLVINATQSLPEGQANRQEIRVTTRMDPSGMVAIDVTDTGSGMSAEVQRRLFTPFFTTKPVGVGTGLGLSICQRIIAAMAGEIRVQSRVGQGSTFTVLLPAASMIMTTTATPTAASSGGAPVVRRGRLLVIDDEKMIAIAVQRSLMKEHDVVYEGSAADALVRLRDGADFDVILCDLMMPEVTGMDFYFELQKSHPDQARRIIFVTGGAFTARAREFLETVPNLHIEKPFNLQQLRALVNERVR